MIPPSSGCSREVLLANKTVWTHAGFNPLGGHLRGDHIFILRRQSSWANADTLVDFVRFLAKVLEPIAQHLHVVLTLDAGPVHLSERVARAFARARIFLHFVPAHMTAWLQPLDAYAFLPLKTVSAERTPRPPSSICVRKRDPVAEHGIAVPRHTLCFE